MSATPFQAPSLEELGKLLPAYEFHSFIAQGGMGAVYHARQRSLERDVAVKILPRELGSDPDFHRSFETEARAMARLNHPNLIGVYDYGDVDGMPYIVMEFVPGSSLHDSAYGQSIDPEQAAAIVKGICDGLGHAHEHGIAHRDIKPANILLTPRAEAKVGDFGLAHPAGSDGPGLVMGTPGYTAPEVFSDPNSAGPLADQYSVGMIFHQLLTGIDPAGSQGPPTQASGHLRLDPIWRRATQPDPSQRYRDVGEMAADLGSWLDARRRGGLVSPPASTPTPPAAAPPLKSARSGGGATTLLVIGVLLALIGFFAFQHLSKPAKSTTPDAAAPQQDDFSPSARSAPDPALHQQTADRVRTILDEADRELAANHSAFVRELNVLETTAPTRHLDLVLRVKRATRSSMPAPVEVGSLGDYPELAELYRSHHARKQEIETSRDDALTSLRQSYIGDLEERAQQADAAGNTGHAADLRKLAADSSRLGDWAATMREP